MSATPSPFPAQPTRHLATLRIAAILSAVFGGPAAWFLQLCAGYALATQPCFHAGHRLPIPPPGVRWIWPAMIFCMIAAILLALIAFGISLSAFRRAGDEPGAPRVSEDERLRTRFLALWGMILGGGFAMVTSFTAVAFVTIPRCAG